MAATGVYTTIYREKLAMLSADDLADDQKIDMSVLYFQVGEGGFEELPNTDKVPKTPVASMTALEAPTAMSAALGDNPLGGYFTKMLTAAQVSRQGRDVTVNCILSANEAGLDQSSKLSGNTNGNPKLFELGVFDGDPQTGIATLIAYCTFDEVVKVAGVQVSINVTIRY